MGFPFQIQWDSNPTASMTIRLRETFTIYGLFCLITSLVLYEIRSCKPSYENKTSEIKGSNSNRILALFPLNKLDWFTGPLKTENGLCHGKELSQLLKI